MPKVCFLSWTTGLQDVGTRWNNHLSGQGTDRHVTVFQTSILSPISCIGISTDILRKSAVICASVIWMPKAYLCIIFNFDWADHSLFRRWGFGGGKFQMKSLTSKIDIMLSQPKDVMSENLRSDFMICISGKWRSIYWTMSTWPDKFLFGQVDF